MGNKISPTTFYEYCQQGNLAAVQTILSQVSPCTKEKLFAHRVEEMPMISTPLFTAIQHHHLPVVQLLLDNGMNPNSQIKVGVMPGRVTHQQLTYWPPLSSLFV